MFFKDSTKCCVTMVVGVGNSGQGQVYSLFKKGPWYQQEMTDFTQETFGRLSHTGYLLAVGRGEARSSQIKDFHPFNWRCSLSSVLPITVPRKLSKFRLLEGS